MQRKITSQAPNHQSKYGCLVSSKMRRHPRDEAKESVPVNLDPREWSRDQKRGKKYDGQSRLGLPTLSYPEALTMAPGLLLQLWRGA